MEDLSRTPPELETLRDFARWAASRFQEAGLVYGHGTDNPIDEAAALVLHTLHLPHDAPPAFWDARLTRAERDAVVGRVRRRIEERLPLAYLTHEAWFAGLPFYVDQRVLVPRSPLAEPIQRAFAPWLEEGAVERVLDVGTGSGCIAVACAYAFPYAQVDAVDVSEEALEVARVNRARHKLEDRLALIRSNLFEQVPVERRYDLIVSNPPYVDAEDMAVLASEYQREPQLGLIGGKDGLDLVRTILSETVERLRPGGILVVEVGNSAAALEAAYPEVPFLWIEFEHGGEGVFMLTAAQLQEHRARFAA